MSNEYSEAAYRILGCSWDLSAPETRRSFAELLNSAEGGAKNFCDLYFDRFLLIHEVGHIVRDLCSPGEPPFGAEEEYLANLFALKYFQFKKCDKFLTDLFRWMNFLLETYQVKFKFDLAAMNTLFEKYRQDRRTYGALQFMCIKEALKDTASLHDVVARISCGKIAAVDSGVILRKDIAGSELLAECVHVVFGMSDIRPAVELRYVPELGVQTRELLRNGAIDASSTPR